MSSTASASRTSEDFVHEVLYWHNVCRSKHGVPVLQLSDELSSAAYDWAVRLANIGTVQSSLNRSPQNYGESIYESPDATLTGKSVVKDWYKEIEHIEFGKIPLLMHRTVHLTQMIWKSTTEMGVGKSRGKTNTYVVVRYAPPGNIMNQFFENVLPPKKLDTSHGK